jgi:hypothetical protein
MREGKAVRSMLFRPTLRQLLSVLFFLFAAISAAAIGVLWTQSAWDREVQTIHDQHLQLANHLAEALTRYAKDVEAVFNLAALNLAKQQPILHLDALLRRLRYSSVGSACKGSNRITTTSSSVLP